MNIFFINVITVLLVIFALRSFFFLLREGISQQRKQKIEKVKDTPVQSTISEPVFIYESGNLLIFTSVAAAQLYIEAIDVINGEYVGYDASGKLLQLKAKSWDSPVHITEITPTVDRSQELHKILSKYLTRVEGSEKQFEKFSLNELVSYSLTHKIE